MKTPHLIISLVVVVLLACNKEQAMQAPYRTRSDFFETDKDLHKTLQTVLDKSSHGEKLQRVESIAYLDAKNKSYAFVFYRSDKGSSNVVLQKSYLANKQVTMSSTRCEGVDCNCQVKTIISDSGDVTLGCSCSSCTMLTNSVSPASY